MAEGFIGNIEDETKQNNNFRRVLFTAPHSQLVVISLKPGEEIGQEVHDGDQFIRIEEGSGQIMIGDEFYNVEDDWAAVIPAGVNHNVINTGDEALKIYTIYSPPEHEEGTVQKTKAEASK